MKRRDLEQQLKALGYQFVREGGSHSIWGKGTHTIAIPRHNEINERLAKAIIKQAKGG